MKIAVLGAGAGGTTTAFDCAAHGHEVGLNEDVGWGLMFMSSLAKQVGVETPTIDGIIQVASVLMNRDYRAEAPRTPGSLGIGGLSAEELHDL